MNGGHYAFLVGVWLAAVIVPGQDLAVVLRETAAGGRRAGIASAAGIATGIAVWTSATILGLGFALSARPMILAVLEIAGGVTLTALSLQGFRRAGALVPGGERGEARPSSRAPAPFRAGLITNLANPKALAFFATLFTTVVPAEATVIDHVAVFIVIVVGEFLRFGAIALGLSSGVVGRWIAANERAVGLVAAFAFLALGTAAIAVGVGRLL